MTSRRAALVFLAAAPVLAAGWPRPARAQTEAQARAFIDATGTALVAVIDGPGSGAQKRAAVARIVDSHIDVDGIARFCLGRFWRVATATERSQYQQLFREALVLNIATKIGEYKGVTFTVGRTTPHDDGVAVATIITRPGNAPADVEWLVRQVGGAPKIVDMVAEGTSLRITQRSDYASYLSQHDDKVSALLTALRAQVTPNG